MLTVGDIARKAQVLKRRAYLRDVAMQDVLSVREGNMTSLSPSLFPADYPRPLIANFVDTVARDLAEVIAPLPSINCSSVTMVSDAARKRADKRTKIAQHYLLLSDLQKQMYTGVDQYLSYGFLPFIVEPDFDAKFPMVRLENPMGCYYDMDRFGRVQCFVKRVLKPIGELAAEYPEYATILFGNPRERNSPESLIEVYRYWDKDQDTMFVPDRSNLVLGSVRNRIGVCPVVVCERPGLGDNPRGQYDDVLWVQLAKAKMAIFMMTAAEKSINAPLVAPADMQEFAIGPDSIMRTANPGGVAKVQLNIPQGVFEQQSSMDEEMRLGARYPNARTGNMDPSNATGRGLQELQSGFDTQVKTAQDMLADALRKTVALLFMVDELLWPGVSKTIRGTIQSAPFETSYTPSKDVAGDYTCEVSYGFAGGMDPNRAVVLLLQLRNDKSISRDFMQRQLPFDLNVTQQQQQIDVEELRDALKQAIAATAQSMSVIIEQQGDPSTILSGMASIVLGVQQGKPIESLVVDAFKPPPPPPVASPGGSATPPGGPGGGGGPLPGTELSGLPQGVAPGQAGLPPGGRPSVMQLMAGLTGAGKPNMAANVASRVPTG